MPVRCGHSGGSAAHPPALIGLRARLSGCIEKQATSPPRKNHADLFRPARRPFVRAKHYGFVSTRRLSWCYNLEAIVSETECDRALSKCTSRGGRVPNRNDTRLRKHISDTNIRPEGKACRKRGRGWKLNNGSAQLGNASDLCRRMQTVPRRRAASGDRDRGFSRVIQRQVT